MPEFRQNPITKEWAVIATERSRRPGEFKVKDEDPKIVLSKDPLLEGHEQLPVPQGTPQEVFAIRKKDTKPNTPGWSVRVVPNPFPIVDGDKAGKVKTSGLYRSQKGIGFHEVVVTKDPMKSEAEMSVAELTGVVEAFQDRYIKQGAKSYIKNIVVFKNHRKGGGSSLPHPHHQIAGSPLIPQDVANELSSAKRFMSKTKKNIFQEIRKQEQRGTRVVYQNKEFLVFCPFFSALPFETWIMPKKPSPRFETMTDAQKKMFADALQALLGKAWNTLENPPFNWYIRTAPFDGKSHDSFQWYLRFFPRLNIQAGFEFGTGMMVNTVAPESAAKFLRQAKRKAS